jgi:hypothetical protein
MNNATRAIRWLAKAAALASSLGLLGSYVYVRAGGTLFPQAASTTSPAFTQDLAIPSTKSAIIFPPDQKLAIQEEEEALLGPINAPQQPPQRQTTINPPSPPVSPTYRSTPLPSVKKQTHSKSSQPETPSADELFKRKMMSGSKSAPMIDYSPGQSSPQSSSVPVQRFAPPPSQRAIPYQSLAPNQPATTPLRPVTELQPPLIQQQPAKKSLANQRPRSAVMQQQSSQALQQQAVQQQAVQQTGPQYQTRPPQQ